MKGTMNAAPRKQWSCKWKLSGKSGKGGGWHRSEPPSCRNKKNKFLVELTSDSHAIVIFSSSTKFDFKPTGSNTETKNNIWPFRETLIREWTFVGMLKTGNAMAANVSWELLGETFFGSFLGLNIFGQVFSDWLQMQVTANIHTVSTWVRMSFWRHLRMNKTFQLGKYWTY